VVKAVSIGGAHQAPDPAVAPPPRVIVIDPAPTKGPAPCFAAQFVASQALARGFKVNVHANVCPGSSLSLVRELRPEIVVLILHGGIAAIATATNRTPWDALATVVRSYRDAGARVVAFDAGAMAAVMAIFAQQGAHPVFELDRLFDEPSALGDGVPSLPPVFKRLVRLTAHERSVLFQLTEGRSAAEIALKMAISLSTVRAHIRSILKKLEVNSQLAAVALAHGTYRRDSDVLAV
jgi:DNA-binding NarL/FixJ family response regulator